MTLLLSHSLLGTEEEKEGEAEAADKGEEGDFFSFFLMWGIGLFHSSSCI